MNLALIFEILTPKFIFGQIWAWKFPDLNFWNSDPKIYFWANLGTKIQSSLFCLKTGGHGISSMLILNSDLDFWNFDHKIQFRANLGAKNESCLFCLKIGTHGISRMLIVIATLVFWILNPNFLFGQICMPTVCQHQFYEFPTLNSFFGKLGPKKSKLFALFKTWHTWYLEDADSYCNICFLNFELKIHFWSNLDQKSQICPFCLKIGTLGILRMRILIPRLVFWILKPKSI